MFAQPRAMTGQDIAQVVERFATTAALAEQAGFTGVQIHAAHGYLLSQFLSPLTNRRTDQWGGSLQNRARLLLDIVRAVRSRVAPGFCVAVKLNSADFQKGGFDKEDARAVVGMLNELPVDLVELSGGSYESPAMQGTTREGSTLAREAYFLEFAADIVSTARMPVMVTGGFRRRVVAQQALAAGIAVVGLARALAADPDLPRRWQAGQDTDAVLPVVKWRHKVLASLAVMSLTKVQLKRIAARKNPADTPMALFAVIADQLATRRRTAQYKRWLAQRPR